MRYLLIIACTLLVAACSEPAVTLEKTIGETEIATQKIVYTEAESLNAVSIWREEFNMSALVGALLGKRDTVELGAVVFEPNDERVRPAVVYIHGGGFVHGSTGVADPTAQFVGMEFARRGYRVFAMEYRSMNLFAPSFVRAGYTAAQDGKAAIRYLRAHSGELNLDPDQIFLIGYSAGGITALNTAYLDAGDELPGNRKKLERLYGDLEPISEINAGGLPIAGVVSIAGGVLDLEVFGDSRVPLCLIHGAEDKIIDPQCAKPFGRAAGLFELGVEQLALAFDNEEARQRVRSAGLPSICGGKSIAEFSESSPLITEYHEIPDGGHFLLLSPTGERTAATEAILGEVSRFMFELVD